VSRGVPNCDDAIVGRVVVVESLSEIACVQFSEPTVVVVTGNVSGDEDIPFGAAAIFTTNTIDVLCHLAVRARTERVFVGLVADASDDECIHGIIRSEGTFVKIVPINSGRDVRVEGASQDAAQLVVSRDAQTSIDVRLDPKAWPGVFFCDEGNWNGDVVGAKAMNLKHLRSTLPADITVPQGVAVPYGSCEAVIAAAENADVRKALDAANGREDALKSASDAVDAMSRLRCPNEFQENVESVSSSLSSGGNSEGLTSFLTADRGALWETVKTVWASKFNQRAILACRKAGLKHCDICMSVLVQEAIDAEYAFVVHTQHPITGSDKDIYCEIVAGLGETLVGNFPGRSLGFSANKMNLSFSVDKRPSKSIALRLQGSTLICRSDSNCEDLPGFAGAGLFDSVFVSPPVEAAHDYSRDRIVCDIDFQESCFKAITEASIRVESSFGSPQDIEGVIDRDGNVTIVQSRPQIV